MSDALIQTRDHSGELRYFETFLDAYQYARRTPTVWKISFNFAGSRVRLVRLADGEPFTLDFMEEQLDALRAALRAGRV